MAAPNRGVCSAWATVDDVCSPCDDYDFSAGVLEDSLLIASNVLFHLSGRQFPGTCTDTVRPCARYYDWSGPRNRDVVSQSGWGSYNYNSSTHSLTGACGCNSPRACGCGGLSEITLGGYPLVSIQEVKVDGVVLPASSYRIDDYRYLVRIDGENFPCCQDLSLPDTADGTFSVTFTYGTPPDSAGIAAAAALGCQIALSCSPETIGECQLPQRVTSITRQGVSMVLLDPFDFLDAGKTGVYLVDLWLKAVNPHGLRRPAAVLSPDIPRRVRRAGT